ncbi:hypothetical protein FB451DRAFT_1397526 [Mycena latifolia]|nr:hypothetical protein FB451DRAFT_1397526 [Mycena latifolia]
MSDDELNMDDVAAGGARQDKKEVPSKSKKEESEVEDGEQSGEEGGEDDEEYVIEAILDAKKGHFPKNKLGWVIEEDPANADELIKAFWAEQKNKSPKKAPELAKRARKSVATDDDSDAERVRVRGEDDERPPKKPPKSGEKKTRARRESADALPEDDEIGNMAQHMHAPTWDQLIKHIDTVERSFPSYPVGVPYTYVYPTQTVSHLRLDDLQLLRFENRRQTRRKICLLTLEPLPTFGHERTESSRAVESF